ncbi:CAAX prenyl protease-related protein [Massilia sp. SR12]
MKNQQPPERVPQQPHAAAATAPAFPIAAPANAAFPRVLPFAIFIAFIALGDVLEHFDAQASSLRWLYPIQIALVLAVLLVWRQHYQELRALPTLRHVLLALAMGALVFVLWLMLDLDWMRIGTARVFDPAGADGRIDWPLVAVRAAGATLVVPLMEELFWRSFLLRWLVQRDFLSLRPARAGLGAASITIVLFGSEHNLWLAGMVAGLGYTLLYMRSETLWTPILGHAVTNGLLAAWVVATGSWIYW